MDTQNHADPQPSSTEALHEQLELSHYIDIFRTSAERVRRLVFIITVFSLAMLVAQWNTTPASWTSKRYQKWEEVYEKARSLPLAQADQVVHASAGSDLRTLEE